MNTISEKFNISDPAVLAVGEFHKDNFKNCLALTDEKSIQLEMRDIFLNLAIRSYRLRSFFMVKHLDPLDRELHSLNMYLRRHVEIHGGAHASYILFHEYMHRLLQATLFAPSVDVAKLSQLQSRLNPNSKLSWEVWMLKTIEKYLKMEG